MAALPLTSMGAGLEFETHNVYIHQKNLKFRDFQKFFKSVYTEQALL